MYMFSFTFTIMSVCLRQERCIFLLMNGMTLFSYSLLLTSPRKRQRLQVRPLQCHLRSLQL